MLFMFIAFVLFVAVLITAWWLWRRATVTEGESSPKWGDLRSFRASLKSPDFIVRMAAVAVLAGLMTIPMGFINGLTNERYYSYKGVVADISSSWGSEQVFTGPVLCVPYTVRYQRTEEISLSAAELSLEQSRGSDRTTKEVVRNYEESYSALVLPDVLNIEGDVATETRSRSIYSARVYRAGLKVSGSFSKPDLSELRRDIADIHWDKAILVVGITSTKAINDISELELAREKHKFLPGTSGVKALPTGFSVQSDLSGIGEGEVFGFRFEVFVGGSDRFYMTPVGVSSVMKLKSDWPHPNFTGSGLPSSREITPTGFSAEWNVPNLVRNYPQFDDTEAWNTASGGINSYMEADVQSGGHNLREYVVGVVFFEPVFHYSLLLRVTKYGLLFIALIFLGVVIFENYYGKKSGAMLNMAQYAVIGLSLSLFYLTLLAVSEHLGFTAAYAIAAAQSVVMMGGYVRAAMRQTRPALLSAGVQALLYALLFFILRMEDYSLLAGAVLLVAATVALMAVTRNINAPKNEQTKQSDSVGN
jgi:inner membrane protein